MLDLFTETKKVSEKEEVILEQQLSMAVQVLSEIFISTPMLFDWQTLYRSR